jgi:hypothetical protein
LVEENLGLDSNGYTKKLEKEKNYWDVS